MLLADECKNMIGGGELILGLSFVIIDQELSGVVLRKSWMEEPGT